MTILCGLLLLAACAVSPPAGKLALEPIAFADLPGWGGDHLNEAVPALQRSCNLLAKRPPNASLGIAGKARDWQTPCAALAKLPPDDDAAARAFFENYFQPYAASGSEGDTGLFTGYYEAELHGSWKRDKRYRIPLYAKPRDLVSVDLGDFEKEGRGKHIEGKVVKGKLKPYDDRAAIEKHSLKSRAHVLLWVDDPVDAFFLSVQGSGRVVMKNGGVVHVGYAAPNGRSYVAIGRVMEAAGDIPKPITMQKIRAWLSEHPEQMRAVMDKNPSYIFFRIIKGGKKDEGPIGAEGIALTPRRSLAVDPAFVPLGVPVWVDTADGDGTTIQRLMIAQDTGGAIKGAVRGDFFWGYGADAEAQAGAMQSEGRYYLLLPKD